MPSCNDFCHGACPEDQGEGRGCMFQILDPCGTCIDPPPDENTLVEGSTLADDGTLRPGDPKAALLDFILRDPRAQHVREELVLAVRAYRQRTSRRPRPMAAHPSGLKVGDRVRYKPGDYRYGYEESCEPDGRVPGVVLGYTKRRIRVRLTMTCAGVKSQRDSAVDAESLVKS